MILRWPIIEPKLKYLSRFNIHSLFIFPFKNSFVRIPIDFKSDWLARDSEPNTVYSQLILEHKFSPEELDVFTDGSRTLSEDGSCYVSCAVFVPGMDITYKLKLNDMTSSYMAEVFAMAKFLICIRMAFCPRLISVLTFKIFWNLWRDLRFPYSLQP